MTEDWSELGHHGPKDRDRAPPVEACPIYGMPCEYVPKAEEAMRLKTENAELRRALEGIQKVQQDMGPEVMDLYAGHLVIGEICGASLGGEPRALQTQSEGNIPMNFDNIKNEPTCTSTAHDPIPVIVCTDKRGVVFGYTTDTNARPIVLTAARMCLYWSADVGGVFGLADVGPTKDCKISAVVPSITLEGVTAIMSVDDKAVKAWASAKTQGR